MSELTQLLISQLLKQKLAEPALQREREERAAELARQRQVDLLQSAIESGANESQVWKLQSLTPDIPANEFEGFATVAGLKFKKAKEEKDRSEALNAVGLSNLASAGAARPDALGRLAPAPQAGQDAYQAGLQQRASMLSDPRDVTRLVQQVEQFRAQEEGAGGQVLATEKRQIAKEVASEGRQNWQKRRENLISSEAHALAYSRQGIVPIDDGVDASIARLVTAGVPRGQARAMALEADHRALGLKPIIAERAASAEGKRTDVQTAEDMAAKYIDSYPELADYKDLARDVRLEISGKAVFNIEAAQHGQPSWILTPSDGEAKRVKSQMEGRLEADETLSMLEDAYVARNQAAKDPSRRGEFLGGPGQGGTLFDVLATVGEGAPEVTAIRTLGNRYILAETKAAAGARASDMDLSFVTLFVPSPTEYGTDIGDIKMKQLRQIQTMRSNLRLSPQERKKITAIRSKYRSETARMRALSEQAARESEASQTGEANPETLKRLSEEAARFQASPAAKSMKRDLMDAGLVSEYGTNVGAGIADKY